MRSKRLFELSIIIGVSLLIFVPISMDSKRTVFITTSLLFASVFFFISGTWGLWASERDAKKGKD